jgi:hypothetical protein
MKLKRCTLIILAALLALVSGCAHSNLRNTQRGSASQYLAPNPQTMPSRFTIIRMKKNVQFTAAVGIRGGISYNGTYWKDGKMHHYPVVDFSTASPNAPKEFIGFIPEPMENLTGGEATVADKCGTVACNPFTGQCGRVKGNSRAPEYSALWAKIDPNSPQVMAVEKGDATDQQLGLIYTQTGMHVILSKNKALHDWVSNHPDESIEHAMAQDSFWDEEWKKLFLDGWKILVMWPLVHPLAEAEGTWIFITKVISIPSFYLTDNIPNCGTYQPDALDTADIALKVFSEYGSVVQQTGDEPLSENFLRVARKTCPDVTTYNQYLDCMSVYIDKIDQTNEEIKQRNAERAQRRAAKVPHQ